MFSVDWGDVEKRSNDLVEDSHRQFAREIASLIDDDVKNVAESLDISIDEAREKLSIINHPESNGGWRLIIMDMNTLEVYHQRKINLDNRIISML